MGARAGIACSAAAVAMLAALPLLRPPAFYESFLFLVFLWMALATSWAMLSGYSGYFSFGHGAFYGAGVYTTATLIARLDMPFVWTLPVAGAVAAALGLAVGAVAFRLRRLRGELFALLTLAVGFVLATVILNTPIDGGPGVFLSGVALPRIHASPASTLYVFGLAIAVLSLAASFTLQRSRLGRGLFAIADDEDVAEVMGVPTYRLKLIAFGLSCFLAGIAGGIHAAFVTYVTVAETFSITVPLFVILMSVLGGARHWLGPAIGAAFVTALSYAFVGGDWAVPGRAIIGLILIAIVLFLPHGVTGLLTARRPVPAAAGTGAIAAKSPPTATRATVATGGTLLRVEGVHLAFRGVKALAGIHLELREGEILGLVGPNGSGKSTLVNAISGYYRPDAGRILLGGHDLAALPAHRIARLGVARTYQIPRPFARLSVRENVAVAAMFGAASCDPRHARDEAQTWLDLVGLGGRAEALPPQLNLHQRKFLELARALAAAPRIVLLDEVLSGLTASEIAEAVAMVRAIRERGATILFIEHNMRAVLELVDRLVVLHHGEVLAAGAPREIVRDPEVITAYLGKSRA